MQKVRLCKSIAIEPLTVEAVDVAVAEHGGGEAGAVGAGRLLVGADGLVRVEERLKKTISMLIWSPL